MKEVSKKLETQQAVKITMNTIEKKPGKMEIVYKILDLNSIPADPIVDFLDAVNCMTQMAVDGRFVYRGYSKRNENWPSICRYRDEKTQLDAIEEKYLLDFERFSSPYINHKTVADFLSNAQHFGIRTRLLDFTYNPFIALYFALNDKRMEDNIRIRYCVREENISLNQLPKFENAANEHFSNTMLSVEAASVFNLLDRKRGNQQTDELTSFFVKSRPFINRKNFAVDCMNKYLNNKLIFLDPIQSNPRIVMQQGLFLLPTTLNKNEIMFNLEQNTKEIIIDKGLRNQLRKYIESIGFNGYRLMPDISSGCSTINQMND